MALADVDTVDSPAWWMNQLAKRMLAPERMMRFATLAAYRAGRPPMLNATTSEREAYYAFNRVARSNFARVIVRAPAERMAIRSIRTAAAGDANGDDVAWSYFRGSGLEVAATDVHTDLLTFSEGMVRVALDGDQPLALRCDPRYTIVAVDPLNPLRTRAAMHLVWDELAGKDYAYLWLPGQQWVAERVRKTRPMVVAVPGTEVADRRWKVLDPYYRLSFSPGSFTMRPDIADVEEPDSGPYSEKYEQQIVPVFRFDNRDGVGEFEEHLDLLDRINHTVMTRVVTAAIQAYKQRALEQQGDTAALPASDKLPDKDPESGEPINWDEMFLPGPDALWKLPPGVKIWESKAVDLNPILSAAKDDLKILSAVTSTPFSMFSPDGVNQTAEGVQQSREGLVFKVEDRDTIAGQRWAQVVACMFRFAPDADRYAGEGPDRMDRADAGRIVIDWKPAERYSLSEMAGADSQNKSLSKDMAAAKIWNLTPDEVALNRAQFMADQLLAVPDAAAT